MNKEHAYGNCQCCGQSIKLTDSGYISEHGIITFTGEREGNCRGQGLPPLQSDRTFTDGYTNEMHAYISEIEALINDYRTGDQHPEFILYINDDGEVTSCTWAKAPHDARAAYIEVEIERLESLIEVNQQIIKNLLALADLIYEG